MISYYTDDHDVDEDKRSIVVYGGAWSYVISAGIARRDMYNIPTYVGNDVASRKK